MRAGSWRGHPNPFRVLALALAVLMSVIVVSLQTSTEVAAGAPHFTRPNVLVDRGPGWVGLSIPGGPVIAAEPGGVLHAAWSDNRTGFDSGIYYARSNDGGMTWIGEQRIDGNLGVRSLAPSIAVDTTGGPYGGVIYVAWQWSGAGSADIYVIRSTDGGATWRDKQRVDMAPPGVGSYVPRLAIDADGRVYIAYQDARSGNMDIYLARSDNGGITWEPEVRLLGGESSDAYLALVAYGSALYLAWQEGSPSGSKVWLAISRDEGNTWKKNAITSVPNSDGGVRAASITVSTNGTIHAAYIYDNPRLGDWVNYTRTTDGGLTWSKPSRVNDGYPTSNYAANSVTLIETAGVLYCIWSDNRNGDSDIYASWSDTYGRYWGDGPDYNGNDIRVDDTDNNAVTDDDSTLQISPYAVPGQAGIYVVWADKRDNVAPHAYFASFVAKPILLTEVRDGPDGKEQVEIFNEGARVIDLTGFHLDIDGVVVDLSPLRNFPAGTYRTIGDPATSDLRQDITLGDEGGTVQIHYPWDTVADAVSYGQSGPAPDPIDSESVARVPMIGAGAASWSRAATPTFGAANTQVPPVVDPCVVLNEVYFNSPNPDSRFIELFFKCHGSEDITGYTLAGDAVYTLPSEILRDDNPFFTVHASQAPALFGMMGVAGDNIYLYDGHGALVDMVGWSSSHSTGTTMKRVPDGFGTATGYSDATSIAAGWRFDQVPSPVKVHIGPRQSKGGDPGSDVRYNLTVTNKDIVSAFVNVQPKPGQQGWRVKVFKADGVTPLTDSPGDADVIPDVGLLPPEGSAVINVSVEIPTARQSLDWEISSVAASPASDPTASADVSLATSINPYISPDASRSPAQIYVEGTPPGFQPQRAVVKLTISGRGTTLVEFVPQDTVLLLDSSGSMLNNDPANLRLIGAKRYVDMLVAPDRVAIVDFNTVVTLVGGDHLSSDYSLVKSNIDLVGHQGYTNILAAMKLATDELIAYGNKSHAQTEILLTDGHDTAGNSEVEIIAEARRAARNGIIIFTIGLIGSDVVDETLLQEIATTTGGTYQRALTASDIAGIYQKIGGIVRNTAGYDDDVTDDIPMVSVLLPDYVHLVPGTAFPPPSYQHTSGGATNIQWNISMLRINDTWTATFGVTSSRTGNSLDVLSIPESRVTYNRYDGKRTSMHFPRVLIDVIAPPPPKFVMYTITRSPAIGTVTVDNRDYPVPAVFTWESGKSHTISAPDFDDVTGGERFAFIFWSDGGARSHGITIGDSDTTLTAAYTLLFRVTVELDGLDGAHGTAAHFSIFSTPTDEPDQYGTWTKWVDAGAPLSFDSVSAGSGPYERWITLEDFATAPWSSIDAPLNTSVAYWHQVVASVSFQGLSPSHPTTIDSVSYGLPYTSTSAISWRNWADVGSSLRIGGRLQAGPAERFINLISPSEDYIEWVLNAPANFTVPFVHQFRPTVALQGLEQAHSVGAHFTALGKTSDQAEVSAAWSDWVDNGSSLSFDSSSMDRGLVERWATLEDFGVPPWIAIEGAFNDTVLYWHQFKNIAVMQGLASSHPVPVDFIQFGNVKSSSSYGTWADWVDSGGSLRVGGRVLIPPAERYVNTIDKGAEVLMWTVTGAATHIIPFLHQFKPGISLIGTDSEHTVEASYSDGLGDAGESVVSGLNGTWSEWADAGSRVSFSNSTTGSPPYYAQDATSFTVDSAFSAEIVYAPSMPPGADFNAKPLISLAFVIILTGFAVSWGYRRPLDRHLLPQEDKARFTGSAELKKKSIEDRFASLGAEDRREKLRRDRRFAMFMLGLPVATVEALIGIVSLFTGFLRVPEAGNWFSIGLIANTFILLAGIAYMSVVKRYGYAAPGEPDSMATGDVQGVRIPAKPDRLGQAHAGAQSGSVAGIESRSLTKLSLPKGF